VLERQENHDFTQTHGRSELYAARAVALVCLALNLGYEFLHKDSYNVFSQPHGLSSLYHSVFLSLFSFLHPQHKLAFYFHSSYGMATIDCFHKATEVHSLGSNFVQTAEAQSVPRVDCGTHSTRTAFQDLPPLYPRIPRRVSRHKQKIRSSLESQFQANARKVQKPLSVIVPVSLFSPYTPGHLVVLHPSE
jgi:hypothetical protein